MAARERGGDWGSVGETRGEGERETLREGPESGGVKD